MDTDGHKMESARLCSKLYQLKTDNVLTDITIICHSKVISAHKCVLAASSQFFKTLFCQDSTYMCGYFQSCDFTDQLDTAASEFLEHIIEFMYSQTVVLNDANVAEIAKLAFFFVVDDLLETCNQFVNSSVSMKNCLDLYVRLNQVAEFRAGPVFLQTLDKSVDFLKVPFNLIQSRFHDVYIHSEALVNARTEDVVQLVSKGVAKSCTIDGIVRFVIRWLQKHPRDEGFEVASLLLDFAMEKSRIPMHGTVSSWIHITNMYDKIEAVLGGSNISQAYQTCLLTKMSAIMEQLESRDYCTIREEEMNAEKELKEEKAEVEKDTDKHIEKDKDIPMETVKIEQTEIEIVRKKGHVCKNKRNCKKCKQGSVKQYHLRRNLRTQDDSKRVSCKVCKLEFREKYHLDRHIKRVHSKKGNISLKIHLSKSKPMKKSTRSGKPKVSKPSAVKTEVKTEEESVKASGEDKVPSQTEKQENDTKPKSLSSATNDYSDISDAEMKCEVTKKAVDEEGDYFDSFRKTDKNVSDLDDGHSSDSTIENQPVDLNYESDAHDEETDFIDSDIKPADVDKILGDLMQLQCYDCKKIFTNKNLLKLHLRSHTDARPFKCKTCDTAFKRSSHLRRHERSHSGQKPFECIVCQSKFVDNAGLKAHLKSHSDDRPFSCDTCHQGYKDEKDFIRHSMLHSQTGRLFKCEVCDKRFTRKYHLTRHTLIHQGKIPRKHKCPHCNESFSRTKALQKHLPSHNGEPGVTEIYEEPVSSHTCEVCGYNFSDVNNLIRHIRVHTGEKPFSCDICGKSFSQKGQLNIHKLTHGGKRQYQCEMCPKLFLTNSGLHKHRRQVHSNYRPYRCEYCGKQFLQKSDLRRHVPMHTGEKNFQCDICAQLFARKDKLVTHFKQEHMQELK